MFRQLRVKNGDWKRSPKGHPQLKRPDADFIEAWNSSCDGREMCKLLDLEYTTRNRQWIWKRRKILVERGHNLPTRSEQKRFRDLKIIEKKMYQDYVEQVSDIEAEAYSLEEEKSHLLNRIRDLESELRNLRQKYFEAKRKNSREYSPSNVVARANEGLTELLKAEGPLTTSNILEDYPAQRVTLLKSLRKLESEGKIRMERRKIRGNSYLWYAV